MTPILYTCAEAGALLDKAPVTVRQLARRHNIGSIVGKTRVFDAADLERLRALPGPGRPKRAITPPTPGLPPPA